MPNGKRAGERCANLDELNGCRLWGSAEYPQVCRGFRAEVWICGSKHTEAMANLARLEVATTPG